jgi:hypothetical protein
VDFMYFFKDLFYHLIIYLFFYSKSNLIYKITSNNLMSQKFQNE